MKKTSLDRDAQQVEPGPEESGRRRPPWRRARPLKPTTCVALNKSFHLCASVSSLENEITRHTWPSGGLEDEVRSEGAVERVPCPQETLVAVITTSGRPSWAVHVCCQGDKAGGDPSPLSRSHGALGWDRMAEDSDRGSCGKDGNSVAAEGPACLKAENRLVCLGNKRPSGWKE